VILAKVVASKRLPLYRRWDKYGESQTTFGQVDGCDMYGGGGFNDRDRAGTFGTGHGFNGGNNFGGEGG